MGEIQLMPVTQDYVLIQEPREYYLRAPSWSTWTEVRLGMFATIIPTGNYSTYCIAETVTPASYLDWFCFGLKDPSSNLPGTAGAQFIGYGWGTTGIAIALAGNQSGLGNMGCTSSQFRISINGTTIITTSTDTGVPLYAPQYSATSYCCFIAQRFVVSNAGLSNQTVAVSSYEGTTAIADTSIANLRNQIFNTTFANSKTLNWFSGGIALPLPCYWYLRLPLNLNRIRISAMEMFKIS